MKELLHKYLPRSFFTAYHKALVFLAAMYYGFPSDRMIVIGVTGTKGKTSTVNFIADLLESAGFKVAALSTAVYRLPGKSWINTTKMTMPGRTQLQRFLQKAHRAGCKYVVIETSSEGIAQHRTTAITYDVAVFTNLSEEHLESHGGFENYKCAKQKLFKGLWKSKHKRGVKKISIVNLDDEYAEDFMKFPANTHFGFTQKEISREGVEVVRASNVHANDSSLSFDIFYNDMMGQAVAPIPGAFNVENLLAAIAVLFSQGISWNKIRAGLEKISPVPGRMQFVEAGQDYKVIVDYAHEPKSLEAILKDARALAGTHKVVVLTGAQGGGRDHAKRPKMGEIAKHNADFVVVTNEDPYDEDPASIIKDVAAGIVAAGGIEGKDFVTHEDRAKGIQAALAKAETGDVVVLAGKGSETVMAISHNKKIPWSDADTVRAILATRR